MAATAEWTPRPGRRDRRACEVAVARYDADLDHYDYLPNVACDSISSREGAEPQAARLRYLTDDRYAAEGWPTQFQTIMRLSQEAAADERAARAARYVVKPDERIVVMAFAEGDDLPWILFDGFARAPRIDVDSDSQSIGFDAVGVAVRLWDEPIHTIIQRDAFEADEVDPDRNVETPAAARFNPDHQLAGLKLIAGNCSADGYDHQPDPEDASIKFPVFVDASFVREFDDPLRPTYWTLEKLARYLIGSRNPDREFVENPDFDAVKALLDSRRPKDDTFDPAEETTYETSPIVLPELDATGRAWPEVLGEQLAHYGFAMAFRCEDDGDGYPSNVLELYRKDGSGPYPAKSIPFQEARAELDTNRTIVRELSISRDFGSAFNGVVVDTAPTLWEIAVILAPAFLIDALDATPSNVLRFRRANIAAATADKDKYRLFVCDELGGKIADRPWDVYRVGSLVDAPPLDLAAIWDAEEATPVRRRRPGRGTLLSRDELGRPRKASLALSTDYSGDVNILWDGSGTWQEVASGTWSLLLDRLGIRIESENPEGWEISQKTGEGLIVQNPAKVVTRLAAPNDVNPAFFLRLTTVIEGDQRVGKPLPRREASLMKFSRLRYVNARDSFRNEMVHKSSPNYSKPETIGPKVEAGPEAKYVRDDREKVEAYGTQVRAATENPPIFGSVTIPWITRAYVVGDQIREIKGRSLSLQVNGLKEQGEAPRYPYVVGVDWSFSGGQATTLTLSDRIAPASEQGAS